MADDPTPPYDLSLQYQAAAVDHCLKLGGVVLRPPKAVGFEGHATSETAPPPPERP